MLAFRKARCCLRSCSSSTSTTSAKCTMPKRSSFCSPMTSLSFPAKDVQGERDLFTMLHYIDMWAKRWRLEFSAKKSKIMCFSVKKKKPKLSLTYFIGGGQIERVPFFDYLGLRWAENAQWHLVQKVLPS